MGIAIFVGPDAAYWATPARLPEILVGASLACWWSDRRSVVRRTAWLAPTALAAIVALSCTLPSGSGPAYDGALPAFALRQRGADPGPAVAGLAAQLAVGSARRLGRSGQLRRLPVPLAGVRAAARARLGPGDAAGPAGGAGNHLRAGRALVLARRDAGAVGALVGQADRAQRSSRRSCRAGRDATGRSIHSVHPGRRRAVVVGRDRAGRLVGAPRRADDDHCAADRAALYPGRVRPRRGRRDWRPSRTRRRLGRGDDRVDRAGRGRSAHPRQFPADLVPGDGRLCHASAASRADVGRGRLDRAVRRRRSGQLVTGAPRGRAGQCHVVPGLQLHARARGHLVRARGSARELARHGRPTPARCDPHAAARRRRADGHGQRRRQPSVVGRRRPADPVRPALRRADERRPTPT